MAITLDFDSVEGVVVGVAHGPLALEDIKECAATMWRLHEGPANRILLDLRDAKFNLNASEVRGSAEFAREHSPYEILRIAFVVTKDLEFGLLKMWEALRDTEGVKISVFRDKERALEWLAGDAA